MCNRYSVNPAVATAENVIKAFQVAGTLLMPSKPNVWPQYQGLIICARSDSGPGRESALASWGLVPKWAPDMKYARQYSTNNARAESLATKVTFRNAYKNRRCLIPATGFCEPKTKVWYEFTLPEQPLFAMAGLWESWGTGDEVQETYTMITTDANPLVAEYHEKQRMPVILEPSDYELWLTGDMAKVGELLQTYPSDKMAVAPIE